MQNLKKKILIMGLPGAGKTTLASKLVPLINAKWLNADKVRKEANDWDFSDEGRKRQAKRMSDFAEKYKTQGHYVVADFVCPTKEARKLFGADFTIWMDTIEKGRVVSSKINELNDITNLPFNVDSLSNSKAFEDTTNMFETPKKIDKHITSFLNDDEIKKIAQELTD